MESWRHEADSGVPFQPPGTREGFCSHTGWTERPAGVRGAALANVLTAPLRVYPGPEIRSHL